MIGKLNHNVEAAFEYKRLAQGDERVGPEMKIIIILSEFFYERIQAVEKRTVFF